MNTFCFCLKIKISLILVSGVFSAVAQQINLQSPANNATHVGIPVALKWQSIDQATTYQLKIATQPNNEQSVIINNETITSALFTLTAQDVKSNTAYYWQVRFFKNNKWSQWSSQWTFHTKASATDSTAFVPQLQKPDNMAKSNSLPVMILWKKVTNAKHYAIQVATVDSFTNLLINKSAYVDTFLSLTNLTLSTKYYWRVSATNDKGTSKWSDVWNFTIAQSTVVSPALLMPEDNSLDQPSEIILTWSVVNNAVSYAVEVATKPTFEAPAIVVSKQNILSITLPITDLSLSTKYYWRVKSITATESSAWSASWNFTTTSIALKAPLLQFPQPDSMVPSSQFSVAWNPVANADAYQFQLSLKENFDPSQIIIDVPSVNSTSYTLSNIPQGIYYWRVAAVQNSIKSSWSRIWKFSVMQNTAIQNSTLCQYQIHIRLLTQPSQEGRGLLLTINAQDQRSASFFIYSSKGSCVYKKMISLKPFSENTTTFNVHADNTIRLASGTYFAFVQIRSSTGSIQSKSVPLRCQ